MDKTNGEKHFLYASDDPASTATKYIEYGLVVGYEPTGILSQKAFLPTTQKTAEAIMNSAQLGKAELFPNGYLKIPNNAAKNVEVTLNFEFRTNSGFHPDNQDFTRLYRDVSDAKIKNYPSRASFKVTGVTPAPSDLSKIGQQVNTLDFLNRAGKTVAVVLAPYTASQVAKNIYNSDARVWQAGKELTELVASTVAANSAFSAALIKCKSPNISSYALCTLGYTVSSSIVAGGGANIAYDSLVDSSNFDKTNHAETLFLGGSIGLQNELKGPNDILVSHTTTRPKAIDMFKNGYKFAPQNGFFGENTFYVSKGTYSLTDPKLPPTDTTVILKMNPTKLKIYDARQAMLWRKELDILDKGFNYDAITFKGEAPSIKFNLLGEVVSHKSVKYSLPPIGELPSHEGDLKYNKKATNYALLKEGLHDVKPVAFYPSNAAEAYQPPIKFQQPYSNDVTRFWSRLSKIARTFALGHSVYEVYNADDKLMETAHQATLWAGAEAGGRFFANLSRLPCSILGERIPASKWTPSEKWVTSTCINASGVVGGIVGAYTGEPVFRSANKFTDRLGYYGQQLAYPDIDNEALLTQGAGAGYASQLRYLRHPIVSASTDSLSATKRFYQGNFNFTDHGSVRYKNAFQVSQGGSSPMNTLGQYTTLFHLDEQKLKKLKIYHVPGKYEDSISDRARLEKKLPSKRVIAQKGYDGVSYRMEPRLEGKAPVKHYEFFNDKAPLKPIRTFSTPNFSMSKTTRGVEMGGTRDSIPVTSIKVANAFNVAASVPAFGYAGVEIYNSQNPTRETLRQSARLYAAYHAGRWAITASAPTCSVPAISSPPTLPTKAGGIFMSGLCFLGAGSAGAIGGYLGEGAFQAGETLLSVPSAHAAPLPASLSNIAASLEVSANSPFLPTNPQLSVRSAQFAPSSDTPISPSKPAAIISNDGVKLPRQHPIDLDGRVATLKAIERMQGGLDAQSTRDLASAENSLALRSEIRQIGAELSELKTTLSEQQKDLERSIAISGAADCLDQLASMTGNKTIKHIAGGFSAALKFYSGMTQLSSALSAGITSMTNFASLMGGAGMVLAGISMLTSMFSEEEDGLGEALEQIYSSIMELRAEMHEQFKATWARIDAIQETLQAMEKRHYERFKTIMTTIDGLQAQTLAKTNQLMRRATHQEARLIHIEASHASYLAHIVDRKMRKTVEAMRLSTQGELETNLIKYGTELTQWLTETAAIEARSGGSQFFSSDLSVEIDRRNNHLKQFAKQINPNDIPLKSLAQIALEINPATYYHFKTKPLVNFNDWFSVLQSYLKLIYDCKGAIYDKPDPIQQAYHEKLTSLSDIAAHSLDFIQTIANDTTLWFTLIGNYQNSINSLLPFLETLFTQIDPTNKSAKTDLIEGTLEDLFSAIKLHYLQLVSFVKLLNPGMVISPEPAIIEQVRIQVIGISRLQEMKSAEHNSILATLSQSIANEPWREAVSAHLASDEKADAFVTRMSKLGKSLPLLSNLRAAQESIYRLQKVLSAKPKQTAQAADKRRQHDSLNKAKETLNASKALLGRLSESRPSRAGHFARRGPCNDKENNNILRPRHAQSLRC